VSDFNKQIRRFVVDTEIKVLEVRQKTATDIFARLMKRTPVDTGNTRFNWTIRLNSPSTRVLKGTDRPGNKTIKRAENKLSKLKDDQPIYISNNVPHIFVLEDGLYSTKNAGKAGSKVTVEGYSTQAPAGMVKLTLEEFPFIVKIISEEVKRK